MNVDNSKPVPKSLHTVSVLVNVARYHMGLDMGALEALERTMDILGLCGRDDPHNLAGQALKQLLTLK